MKVVVASCASGYLVEAGQHMLTAAAAEAAGERLLVAARAAAAMQAREDAAPLPGRILLYLARAGQASAGTIAAGLRTDVALIAAEVNALLAADRLTVVSGFDVPQYRARAAR